jgi:AP-1 complex subunit gamma-1
VKDDWVRVLIVLISNAPELQGYTVRSFYRAFQDTKNQESLTVTAVWCIGEYGEMLINHANELEGEEPLTVSCFLKLCCVLTSLDHFKRGRGSEL